LLHASSQTLADVTAARRSNDANYPLEYIDYEIVLVVVVVLMVVSVECRSLVKRLRWSLCGLFGVRSDHRSPALRPTGPGHGLIPLIRLFDRLR